MQRLQKAGFVVTGGIQPAAAGKPRVGQRQHVGGNFPHAAPADARVEPVARDIAAQPVRSSLLQPLMSSRQPSRLVESYSAPTHSAGSAQRRFHGPPSAPRISRNFFRRTSGKAVVRWSSQSAMVGYSPGSAGSLPAMKSRNDCPAASM